jgi:hypothetical protein
VNRFRIASAVAVLALATTTLAQETIENPEFKNWSKFKKGTSVTLKNTTTSGEIKSESTITTTLVEVGADKLVVEMAITAKVNDMEFKQPPMKRDVTKTITLPAGVPKPDPAKKPEGTVEEGTETVKIGGAEYKTKWYKTKTKAAGVEAESKTWTSDDVPGGLVKSETTTTGAAPATVKLEVTEVKKP